MVSLGFQGKTALVTGGTRGVGRATVLMLASAGARVVACHRDDAAAAAKLASDLGLPDKHHVVQADVTDRGDLGRLADVCRSELGTLDLVVNNVGIDAAAELGSLTRSEWDRVVTANLTSMYLVTSTMLGLLGGGASVVNVGSALAHRGMANRAHYSASKAGVLGLTRTLCKELGPRGIRVNAVMPGVLDKDGQHGPPPQVRAALAAMTALGRLARPEDVAAAVLFLGSDLARAVTGETLTVDAGV